MNWVEYFLYGFAVVTMIATPGPVMLLVASAGLKGGYKKALQTIFGTNLASLILIALSVLILKGLLDVSEFWFDVIKAVGCLYIAYLGLSIMREALSEKASNNQIQLESSKGGFKQGFLVGISNPKDIIFFASFFPQFVGITTDLNLSLVILTLSWIVLDFATLSFVYFGFSKLSKSKVYHHILMLCGLILVLVACYGIVSLFL